MALVDASGTSAGVATTTGGTPALSTDLGGSGAGSATSSGEAAMNMASGAGSAAGSSTTVGGNALSMVLAGLIAGAATVTGGVDPEAAGEAAGAATASATAVINHGVGETVQGSATPTATAALNIYVTGQIQGQGTAEADYTLPVSGTAAGQATVSTVTPIRIRDFTGRVFGTSLMVWSFPLPMVGKATMVAHVEVETHLPPINAIVAPPKSFRWLQLLQRGDLPVYLSDNNGPVSPWNVRYTLFQKRPNGTRFQVGPGQRAPVSGLVGEYYAVGRAGEGGQPGEWVIRWEFQRSFEGALQTEEMDFLVLDAVAVNDPNDTLVRIKKFGWT